MSQGAYLKEIRLLHFCSTSPLNLYLMPSALLLLWFVHMQMMCICMARITLHGTLLPSGSTNTIWPQMVLSTGKSQKSFPYIPLAIHLTLWPLLFTQAPLIHWVSFSLSLLLTSPPSGKPLSPRLPLWPNHLLPALSPTKVESWLLSLWCYPGYGTMPLLLLPPDPSRNKSDLFSWRSFGMAPLHTHQQTLLLPSLYIKVA
jgi:hypothetical protein